MSMRMKNKATSWKYDGKRGRKISHKHANILERREAKTEIKSYIKQREKYNG